MLRKKLGGLLHCSNSFSERGNKEKPRHLQANFGAFASGF
jgi:hypothetical protein